MRHCDEETAIRRLKDADLVIFNIHGGGFRVGHAVMYMETFISWLEEIKSRHGLNAVILSVEYGLAPKHKYPGPVLECVEAYKYVTESLSIPASKVVLTGDSAGGALVLETLVRTYAPGLLTNPDALAAKNKIDLPAGMVLVSPLVTANSTSESWKKFEKTDLVSFALKKLIYKEFLDSKCVNVDTLPIINLSGQLQYGFNRFAPKNVMIFVGDKEVMRDDILAMAETVRTDGYAHVKVHCENYEHDWYLIREIVKQKDKPMLKRYDESFADFAVKAINEAAVVDPGEIIESLEPLQAVSKILQDIAPPTSNIIVV
ncbi:hypothetical protein DFQ28_001189 [Apophysomyces sp. BC1034]|nr:hypothetical protein DFQ28_001189 [Apophysomyces sp. BC1034]